MYPPFLFLLSALSKYHVWMENVQIYALITLKRWDHRCDNVKTFQLQRRWRQSQWRQSHLFIPFHDMVDEVILTKVIERGNSFSYFDNIFVLISMDGGWGPGHQRQRHWLILFMLFWYWKCIAFWFLSCLFVCGLNFKCSLNLDLMISLCYT